MLQGARNRLNRLRWISIDEATCRVRLKGAQLLERVQATLRQTGLDDLAFVQHLSPGIQGGIEHVQNIILERRLKAELARFFPAKNSAGSSRAFLAERYPEWVSRTVEAADQTRSGRFHLLDVDVTYERPIPWQADPATGRAWPRVPYHAIRVFAGDEGYGDIKHVWELNRHQFLIDVAKAYWLTGEERYAETCLGLIEEWIEANPYLIGVNWASGLEVAVRSLSWTWAYFLCLRSRAMDSRRHFAILKSLYLHGQYLERHLSVYFSPYNHLIGEAAALACLGTLFPEFRSAARWKGKGWEILSRQVALQFHRDGGTVEQATSYHHFTLGFYLLAALVRRLNGESVEAEVWEYIERAIEFSMCLMRPDGRLPMIGDNDDARSIVLGRDAPWDFRSFLAIGAALFHRADFKRLSGGYAEAAFWLLGRDGWQEYGRLPDTAPELRSVSLRESGYCVMRTPRAETGHYLCFDCGPLAAGVFRDGTVSAAHGHADALSFELAAYGRPMLIDPGFYTYNGDPRWHQYFRDTMAHNTVVVDGRSQAEHPGRLKWSHAPRVELHRWLAAPPFDYVEASHDGYRRLPQPVGHRRIVAFAKPDYWLVRDELTGEGEHELDRYFHFAPAVVRCHVEERSVLAEFGTTRLAIVAVEKAGVVVGIRHDGEAPEDGWVADAYGRRARAPIACYGVCARVPIALHTLLIPFRGDACEVEIAVLGTTPAAAGARAQAISVTIDGRQDVWLFSSGGGMTPLYGQWQTDGRVACLRLDARGRVSACLLVDGSTVAADGQRVLELGQTVAVAARSLEDGQPVVTATQPDGDLAPPAERCGGLPPRDGL